MSLQYDPGSALPDNEFTDEQHSLDTSALVSPLNGPFFLDTLVIKGRLNGSGSIVNLIPNIHYSLSPMFLDRSVATGQEIYSHIVVLKPIKWDSVSLDYHALGGPVDTVLAAEIAGLGNVDTLDPNVWLGLQGDSTVTDINNLPLEPASLGFLEVLSAGTQGIIDSLRNTPVAQSADAISDNTDNNVAQSLIIARLIANSHGQDAVLAVAKSTSNAHGQRIESAVAINLEQDTDLDTAEAKLSELTTSITANETTNTNQSSTLDDIVADGASKDVLISTVENNRTAGQVSFNSFKLLSKANTDGLSALLTAASHRITALELLETAQDNQININVVTSKSNQNNIDRNTEKNRVQDDSLADINEAIGVHTTDLATNTEKQIEQQSRIDELNTGLTELDQQDTCGISVLERLLADIAKNADDAARIPENALAGKEKNDSQNLIISATSAGIAALREVTGVDLGDLELRILANDVDIATLATRVNISSGKNTEQNALIINNQNSINNLSGEAGIVSPLLTGLIAAAAANTVQIESLEDSEDALVAKAAEQDIALGVQEILANTIVTDGGVDNSGIISLISAVNTKVNEIDLLIAKIQAEDSAQATKIANNAGRIAALQVPGTDNSAIADLVADNTAALLLLSPQVTEQADIDSQQTTDIALMAARIAAYTPTGVVDTSGIEATILANTNAISTLQTSMNGVVSTNSTQDADITAILNKQTTNAAQITDNATAIANLGTLGRPTIEYPRPGDRLELTGVTILTYDFINQIPDTIVSADYQVSTDIDFTTIVDSGTETGGSALSHIVTATLLENKEYFFRVRITRGTYGVTAWSLPVAARTFAATQVGGGGVMGESISFFDNPAISTLTCVIDAGMHDGTTYVAGFYNEQLVENSLDIENQPHGRGFILKLSPAREIMYSFFGSAASLSDNFRVTAMALKPHPAFNYSSKGIYVTGNSRHDIGSPYILVSSFEPDLVQVGRDGLKIPGKGFATDIIMVNDPYDPFEYIVCGSMEVNGIQKGMVLGVNTSYGADRVNDSSEYILFDYPGHSIKFNSIIRFGGRLYTAGTIRAYGGVEYGIIAKHIESISYDADALKIGIPTSDTVIRKIVSGPTDPNFKRSTLIVAGHFTLNDANQFGYGGWLGRVSMYLNSTLDQPDYIFKYVNNGSGQTGFVDIGKSNDSSILCVGGIADDANTLNYDAYIAKFTYSLNGYNTIRLTSVRPSFFNSVMTDIGAANVVAVGHIARDILTQVHTAMVTKYPMVLKDLGLGAVPGLTDVVTTRNNLPVINFLPDLEIIELNRTKMVINSPEDYRFSEGTRVGMDNIDLLKYEF